MRWWGYGVVVAALSVAAMGCQPADAACDPYGVEVVDLPRVIRTPDDIPDIDETCALLAGSLTIRSDTLTDLAGLENLGGIGGSLHIVDSPKLADISGLTGLEYVAGDLIIENLPRLEEIELPTLRAVGGDLYLDKLESATGIEGLSELRTVAGHAQVRRLGAMTVFESGALESIGGSLAVEVNPELRDVRGSVALTDVGDCLVLFANENLRTVGGFLQVRRLARVWIRRRVFEDIEPNSQLGNCESHFALEPGNVRDVVIGPTNNLETVEGFEGLDVLGRLLVHDNAQLQRVSLPGLIELDELAVADNAELLDLLLDPVPRRVREVTIEGATNILAVGPLRQGSFAELTIEGVSALHDLRGIAFPQSAAQLWIRHNPDLLSLDGLAIERFDGAVIVEDNPALADVRALERTRLAHDVVITGNRRLWQPQALAVALQIDVSRILSVHSNREGPVRP